MRFLGKQTVTLPGLIVSLLLSVVFVAAVANTPPGNDKIAAVTVEGTDFVVRLASGREMRGADLKGATLTLAMTADGEPRRIRIDSVKTDPDDPDRETTLYHLFSIDEHGVASELCEPDAQGERWGFPLRGQWDPEGQHVSDKGYTLNCTASAQGKCVRFGYKPWKTLQDGTSLAPYHQACVRAVRADYCGGHGTTRNGMLVDIYDSLGIMVRDPAGDTAAGVHFEAAWTPSGAACVAHTRVPEKITLQQLAKECPRLRGHIGGNDCSEEGAKKLSDQVLIFNGSR
ncbi:MAG: hypothetical protein JSR66_23695 [Proteobacteria bacterium]|nr:hypothetical protein [Pseudomonadota bacterium]